jgi:hypothetical protein
MRDAAHAYLCDCARARRTTTYNDLWSVVADRLGLDLGDKWRQMRPLLNHVTQQYADDDGDVLVTALVLRDDGDGPSGGFFRLAVDRGLLAEEHRPPEGEDWQMSDVQRAFWEAQVEAAFARFAPP